MQGRLLVLLSLAAVALAAKEFLVLETSDAGFNAVMHRFNDRMSVKVEEGSVSILGGCNVCSLDDSLSCKCTKRLCFRETPSEDFMCEVLAQKQVLENLRQREDSHQVVWRIGYEKTEPGSRIPYSLKVQWIRFKLVV